MANSIEADNKSDQDHVRGSVPWHLVTEYLTLPELLVARQVCRLFAEGVNGLSPATCAGFLEDALTDRNMYVLPYGSWYDAVRNKEELAKFLIGPESSQNVSCAFYRMLRSFRVMQCMPVEMAVAYCGKYGRHALPMLWNEEKQEMQVKKYEPCSRRKEKCSTCKFQIPLAIEVAPHVCRPTNSSAADTNEGSSDEEGSDDDDTWNDINQHLSIERKDESLDLTRFYNICSPNLPSDLICPCCQNRDERTLVLSEFSYKSVPGGGEPVHRVFLTFSPDVPLTEGHALKRRRLEGSDTNSPADNEFVYPPVYQDMAVPSTLRPFLVKSNAKHTIAIHCVSCQQFGMLSPAGPCHNRYFPCKQRSREVQVGKYPVVIGGAFVRRKCQGEDCNQAVLCTSCSYEVVHQTYYGHVNTHKNRCQNCKLIYCEDCSWLATVCCHW